MGRQSPAPATFRDGNAVILLRQISCGGTRTPTPSSPHSIVSPCDDTRLSVRIVHYHLERKEEVSIMRIQHWQDAVSLLLGVWLVFSPFALGFAGAAAWITIVLGASVILLAVEGFVIPSYLEEWGEVLVGLALVVAPWTVGYEPASATVSSVVSGILVIVFAAWELMTDRDFVAWWHDRWHHTAS
jgi:SPW repeat